NVAPELVGTMMLLPDGTVMAQGGGSSNIEKTWYKLTPDNLGDYVNGTWSQMPSMGHTRLYYGSNVLPDDRVFVIGGEYSDAGGFTRTGETYDMVANQWTPTANFPQSSFGDDPTVLLRDGRILAGYLNGPQTYLYDPTKDSWTQTGTKL